MQSIITPEKQNSNNYMDCLAPKTANKIGAKQELYWRQYAYNKQKLILKTCKQSQTETNGRLTHNITIHNSIIAYLYNYVIDIKGAKIWQA